MDYNFYTLNSKDFEHMIQSLMQSLLGNSSLIFGEGRDGARELTYRGLGRFDNNERDGYWVIQAKFKSKADKTDDYLWVKKNYDQELAKFRDEKRKLEKPDNYILFTNASLSAVSRVGGIDKIQVAIEKDKEYIPNINIITYDGICRMLDNNRNVATSYASFVLPGDILQELYNLFNDKQNKKNEAINRFLYKEFKNELNAKLIQAGDLSNQVKIENVFIDLYATRNGQINNKDEDKFVENLILESNQCRRNSIKKLVLIGEAGAGKSTLSQYIVQLYSAFLLHRSVKKYPEVDFFIETYSKEEILEPSCLRMPFKIILKEYAEWINMQKHLNQSFSVVSYLAAIIKKGSDIDFSAEDILYILNKASFIFIFDGLDEVPTTSNRGIVVKEINDFIEIEIQNDCDAIVIATTRPQGFSDEFSPSKFEHLKVCELNPQLCLLYLTKLLNQIESSSRDKESLLNTLESAIKEEITGRLMKTPLQATIMTLLVKSGGKPSHNRFYLFKDYYDTIMKRERQKGVYSVLMDYERLVNEIHFKLAFHLQQSSENEDNPSAYMLDSDFHFFINGYLEEEGFDNQKINEISEQICKNVTERLVFISEVQDGKIGFIIRSMQEFFAANYFLSKKDDEIIQIVEDISKNIYWRNTLLFLIGGIQTNHRRVLVDRIITLCGFLNGTNLNPQDHSSSLILKLGSWLALDILVEGTFIDSPKYQNSFASLLEPLFHVPYISTHEKINKLPLVVLSEWVIDKYLLEKLSQFSLIDNRHLVRILLNVMVMEELEFEATKLLYKYWPKNEDENLSLLKLTGEYVPHSSLFRNKLISLFEELPLNIFIKNFGNDEDILHIILDSKKTEKTLEILFLTAFQSHRMPLGNWITNDILQLIFSVSKTSFSYDETNTLRLYEVVDIEIASFFFVKVGIINSNNLDENENNILNELISIYQIYGLKYIEAYLNFIKEPSKKNVEKLLFELYSQDQYIIDFFFQNNELWYLRYINGKILENNDGDINNTIKKTIEAEDFLINNKNDIIATFNYLKHYITYSINYEKEDIDFDLLYNNLLKNNDQNVALKELFYAFNALTRNLFIEKTDKQNILVANNIKQMLLSALIGQSVFDESINVYWSLLVDHLSIPEIIEYIELSDASKFSSLEEMLRYYYYFYLHVSSSETLTNVIYILNQSILSKKKSNIIYIILNVIGRNRTEEPLRFNVDIKSFLNIHFNDIKDKEYQIVIYLAFCQELMNDDKELLFKKIDELFYLESSILYIIIEYLTRFGINRQWVENFILDIIIKMKEFNIHDDELLELYYSHLKIICEQKKSNLNFLN